MDTSNQFDSLSVPPTQTNNQSPNKQRLNCLICGYQLDPNDSSKLVEFRCNLREFWDEPFQVWRCPDCRTIHCLEVVAVDKYYENYPHKKSALSWAWLAPFSRLHWQLTKAGLTKQSALLDYGCGGNGLFVQYLKKLGYQRVWGYDPYAPANGFGDPAILEKGPFNHILLQDIIEHVEDPRELLTKLDGLLAPGGTILIGTPNADNIDLTRPNISDFYNQVHVPCHLHLYPPDALKKLGEQQGWKLTNFFTRGYDDTRWFGFNTRTWNAYQRCCDGTLDAVYEPIQIGKLLGSWEIWFLTLFGYVLSYRTDMAATFYKSD